MKRWRSTQVPDAQCPFCGHRLDRAGSPEGQTPKSGDISVCIECSSALVYEKGLTLRAMTNAEIGALPAAERHTLRRYQAAVREIPRNLRTPAEPSPPLSPVKPKKPRLTH